MFSVRKMVYTAILIAVGVVLPVTLHAIPNAGSVLLPMHIPVLLCGIVCGFPYGLACGVLTPFLSSLITGMPPAVILPSMLCELMVYGLAASLLVRVVRTPWFFANIYITLAGSMLAGRLVFGALNALFFKAGAYSMDIWVASAFVTALPGIIIQLALLPAAVLALRKAGIVKVFD